MHALAQDGVLLYICDSATQAAYTILAIMTVNAVFRIILFWFINIKLEDGL